MQTFDHKWDATGSIALTANASAAGLITVADTSALFVGQMLTLTATGMTTLYLQVKEVPNSTTAYIGPNNGARGRGSATTDLSGYTTAKSAAISATAQNRSQETIGQPVGTALHDAAYLPEPYSGFRHYHGSLQINPQFGKVAAASITNAYTTVLTAAKDSGMFFFFSDLDQIVRIGINGVDMFEFSPGNDIVADFKTNNLRILAGDLLQVKYLSTPPASGSVRITLF